MSSTSALPRTPGTALSSASHSGSARSRFSASYSGEPRRRPAQSSNGSFAA